MKILKIFLKNIHSLRGEHNIDFANGILADAGLYAITGQTGAGKSTILDAITLSLYGETNRHGKGKADEIITRNEKEAISETIFEVNQKQYMARWSVSYNRNNNLNDWELKLYLKNDIDFVILSDKKSVSLIEIQKIVGLTYEQFTKSILLAQNNFSAFLKAKSAERADMLSKITGTEIYEIISKTVFEKTKLAEDEINNLKLGINNEILTDDAILNFKENLQSNENLLLLEQKNKNDIIEKINWLQEIDKTKNEITKNESEKIIIDNLVLKNEILYQKLELYNKAILIKPELNAFENSEIQKNINLKDLDQINSDLKLAQNNQITFSEKLKLKTTENENFKTEIETKIPKIKEAEKIILSLNNTKNSIKDFDFEIQKLSTEITDFQSKRNEINNSKNLIIKDIEKTENIIFENNKFSKWNEETGVIKNIFNEIKNTEADISKINISEYEKEVQKLTSDIRIKMNENDDLSFQLKTEKELLFEIQKSKESYKTTNELRDEKEKITLNLDNLEKLQNITLNQNELNGKISKDTLELDKLILKEKDKKILLISTEKNIELLIENLQLQEKIASFEEHRLHLKPGENCPLCGSLEHPFILENIEIQVNVNKNEIEDFKLKIKELKAELNLLLADIIKFKTTIDFNKNLVIENEIKISDLKFFFSQTIDFQAINTFKNQILDINLSLEKVNKLEKDELIINENISKITNLIQKIDIEIIKLESDLTNKKLILTNEFNTIETKKDSINLAYQNFKTIFQKFDYSLNTFDLKSVLETVNEIHPKFEKWKNANEILPKFNKELTDLEILISSLDNNYQSSLKQINDLENKLKIAKDSKNNLELELDNLTTNFTLKNPTEEENRLRIVEKKIEEELNEFKNTITGIKVQISGFENNIVRLNNDKNLLKINYISSLNTINEKLKLNNFGSIEGLKYALLLENTEKIALEKKNNFDLIAQFSTLITRLQNQLIELKLKNLTDESVSDLLINKTEIDLKITEINQDIGRIKEKLNKDLIDKKSNQTKLDLINFKNIKFEKLSQINKLIGSKSGDSFKKFAQDFTLSLLVQYANKHLEIMYNRYELFKDDNSIEMELQIKDKHFYDQIRTVNSLSGGETFLVSLSLALGLSDLASKNTKIRSLFIDEGFGSLDPESLNNALDALELLQQSEDRQIGIISHVEELKKRIHTQIKVVKISPEFSHIKVS